MLARIRRERHADLAILVCSDLTTAIPTHRVLHVLSAFIEHGERKPRRPRPLHEPQRALVDHRAARHAVANELDDVDARLPQRVELECTAHAANRRLRELGDLLLVGNESIEIDRRVDGLALVAQVCGSVDAIQLHEQHRHVLDVDLDRGGCIRREARRLRRRKRQLHAVDDLLVARRVLEHRVPPRHIAFAAQQLGLGEQALHPICAHEGRPLVERVRGREQLLEARANDAIVAADARQARLEVGVALHSWHSAQALHPLRIGASAGMWQAQVRLEPRVLDDTAREIVLQPMEQHVRLQGRVHIRQRSDELLQSFEMLQARRVVDRKIDIR